MYPRQTKNKFNHIQNTYSALYGSIVSGTSRNEKKYDTSITARDAIVPTNFLQEHVRRKYHSEHSSFDKEFVGNNLIL